MKENRTVLYCVQQIQINDTPYHEIILEVRTIEYENKMPIVYNSFFTNPFDLKYYCNNAYNLISIILRNMDDYVWIMENIRPYFKSPEYENYTSLFIEKNKDKKEQPKIFLKWVFSNIHNVIKLK